MIKEVMSDAKERMEKTVEAIRHEMATVRTGRASPSLLDGIRVNYYGSPVPISHVANIGIPEPRLIVIQPWDKTVLPEVEKAILASKLGLTPSNDGHVIRLPIPELTEERRKDLVRLVRKLAEDGRVAVRNIRRDGNETLKEFEKESEISEDNSHRAQKEIQELTDKFIEEIDDILEKKEQEIMEV